MNITKIALTAAAALAATSWSAFAADISGAGATFPYPIYAKWADAYKKETGIGMNYQSIGLSRRALARAASRRDS